MCLCVQYDKHSDTPPEFCKISVPALLNLWHLFMYYCVNNFITVNSNRVCTYECMYLHACNGGM